MLIELEGVPEAALPLEAMKAQLRLGTGFGDEDVQDALIAGYLRAALAAIEARIGKALFLRDFRWVLRCWRETGAQALPMAPVRAIAALRIVDAAGAGVTIDPARYGLAPDIHRPRLVAKGASLPVIPEGGQAEIAFQAGFGATWSEIPADLRQAVLLLAARYHEFRHEAAMEAGVMPFGVGPLIEPWRNVRVLGGGAR